MGRPETYSPEQRAAFCEELAEWLEEGNTLREFCRLEGKPSKSRFYDWIEGDPALAGRIAHARARGFDAIAEHSLAIADGAEEDDVQRSKLRFEARLKLLAKWDPRRYGDNPQAMQEPTEGEGERLLRDLEEARRRGGGRGAH